MFMFAMGCSSSASIAWDDPCAGGCDPATEICMDISGGGDFACVAQTDCDVSLGLTMCAYADGSMGCVDTMNDAANCGGCSDVDAAFYCASDEICAAGACLPSSDGCPAVAPDLCDSGCTDTTSDPLNCGSCGFECIGDCVGGAC
jgi:hypothetical protein